MTNGSEAQVTTIQRDVDTRFLLTHEGQTHLFETEEGDIDEAIAYVASYLQIDHVWIGHVTNENLWIAIGVEE